MIGFHAVLMSAIGGSAVVSAQVVYTNLGCFVDSVTGRALRSNEGRGFSILDDNPSIRTDAINKCLQVARQLQHNVFALQDGECFSRLDLIPNGDYARYNATSSSVCPSHGRGSALISNVYSITGAAALTLPNYAALPYNSLGCWRDDASRPALRTLEGSDAILDGTPFLRVDAINKCHQVASKFNLTLFGLSDGGRCWGALDNVVNGTYTFYGNVSYCPRDGKGDLNVNHVYQIKNAANASSVLTSTATPYTSLGCWLDNPSSRSFRLNEGVFGLNDSFQFRTDAINKCYQAASQQGHNLFALQNGGQCYSVYDKRPGGSYSQNGNSVFCPRDGKGSNNVNHVYQVNSIAAEYYSIGCWRFEVNYKLWEDRAYDTYYRYDLGDKRRWDPQTIFAPFNYLGVAGAEACSQIALRAGHNTFALMDKYCFGMFDPSPPSYGSGPYIQTWAGGGIWTCPASGADMSYRNQGYRAESWQSNAALHIYKMRQFSPVQNNFYQSLGCWSDNPDARAVRLNEGVSATLDGDYRTRSDAIHKCYQVAKAQGHNVFALQDGGQCYSSIDVVPGGSDSQYGKDNVVNGTYSFYGNVSYCPRDGKGDLNVNHVYQIKNAANAPSILTSTAIPYTSLGCWLDNPSSPSFRLNEGVFGLNDSFQFRTDAINKCYQAASQQGHNLFALQNGGQCYSVYDKRPGGSYSQNGNSVFCPRDGKGSNNVNHVYQVNSIAAEYYSIGCWRFEVNYKLWEDRDSQFGYIRYDRGEKRQWDPQTIFPPFNYLGAAGVEACSQLALRAGHNTFALMDKYCFGMFDPSPPSYGSGPYIQTWTGGSIWSCPANGQDMTYRPNGYRASPLDRSNAALHIYKMRQLGEIQNNFYQSLGCWSDNPDARAVRLNEGQSATLDGDYRKRADAIHKCYQVAKARGHNVFALQDGGQCYSSLDVVPGGSYSQYGNASSCPADGRGALNINHVYAIKNAPNVAFDWPKLPYSSLGCFRDKDNDTTDFFDSNEVTLGGDYRLREDAINKCYQIALKRNSNIFMLQDGGKCFSGFDIVPGGDHARDGISAYCPLDGKGGKLVNHVYRITSAPPKTLQFSDLPYVSPAFNYSSWGCWKDDPVNKLLPVREGFDPILDGDPATRSDPINKCYEAARIRGHDLFAIQQGACYTVQNGVATLPHTKIGRSPLCPMSGRGRQNINHVYRMNQPDPAVSARPYDLLGCFNDNTDINYRTLHVQEGTHPLVSDSPLNRTDPITKCYRVALEYGHNIFALQNGTCLSSTDYIDPARGQYAKFGATRNCSSRGVGGALVNHVYRINNASDSPDAIRNTPRWKHYGCANFAFSGSSPNSPWVSVSVVASFNTRRLGPASIEDCYKRVKASRIMSLTPILFSIHRAGSVCSGYVTSSTKFSVTDFIIQRGTNNLCMNDGLGGRFSGTIPTDSTGKVQDADYYEILA